MYINNYDSNISPLFRKQNINGYDFQNTEPIKIN